MREEDQSKLFDINPHAKRGLMVTKLVNEPGVSLKECMMAARHTSVSAHSDYMDKFDY